MVTAMRFTCEKALLQTAISTTGRAVAVKTSIAPLEGILVEALDFLRLTGYNLETGIQATVPAQIEEEGTLVLSARLFSEIVRKLPDEPVQFSAQGLTVKIDCGMSHYTLQAIDPDEFPELPEVRGDNALTMKQSDLKSMISETIFAVSTQDIRPIHTGSLFEVEDGGLTMVSLDGFRLALRREKYLSNRGEDNYSFVVPAFALNEVEKICGDTDEPVTITPGAAHILFTVDDTIVVCRRLEGEFLNYKQSISRENKLVILGSTRELQSSIARVSLILSDKLKNPLRCTFKENQLFITTKSAIGDASDVCPVEGDGQGLEIGFDNRYLSDALRFAPAERVRLELNTPVSPCVILPEEAGDERFLYLVLPVRLKAGD